MIPIPLRHYHERHWYVYHNTSSSPLHCHWQHTNFWWMQQTITRHS